SYLLYSFPCILFHEYRADRTTYAINFKVPKGVLVAGYSEQPVAPIPGADQKTKEEFTTWSFTCSKPVLPGTFAAAKYIVRNSNRGGFAVDFYVKAGDEKWADHAVDVIGKHLEYYSSKFGRYAFGNRLVIAEADEETLAATSGPAAMLLPPRPHFAH